VTHSIPRRPTIIGAEPVPALGNELVATHQFVALEKVAGSIPVGQPLGRKPLRTGTKTSNYAHWRLAVRSPNAISNVIRAPTLS
jgi:hypothetical protein